MALFSRQQFVEQVLQVVRERFPLVKVAKAPAQSFSLQINGHVAPLENLYRLTKLHPEDMRRQIERWMVELLRAEEGIPDRDSGFEEVRDRILPMVLGVNTTEVALDNMITQPWVDGLVIGYAIDHDRTIAYVARRQYERWGVDLDEMHEIALRNLVQRSEAINAHASQDEDGTVNLVLFQTMDGYDASRILLPSLHERLREHLGTPFAAAIPNRDILICFRDDLDLISRVKQQVVADYRSMPHQVFDRLLLVTADGIASYYR